ncbi:MAG: SDR family oxidoreductase [Gammaproteobacteria bacterium]|nr:SDR family oxidoreductase [Gammaproteobacteria bacterium]
MTESVLITGADGYFGGMFTEKYLTQSDNHLLLWVRARDRAQYQSKCEQLSQRYSSYNKRRFTICGGDLADPEPFAGINGAADINAIVHTAAITRFNVEPLLADAVNRDGTRKVASFASQCPRLGQLAFISTIYSSGLAPGCIAEAPVSPAGPFANHYERSKSEAEYLLQTEFAHLPWNIFRAATIIADDESGNVVQYNVFHNTMRLFFHGLISLLPGYQTTPIYLTTGRSTVNAVYQILSTRQISHKIYNVCYGHGAAMSMGGLIDRAFSNFANDADFRKKRILKPLFTDLEAFESLASVLKGLSGAVVKQALDSIRPFAKQLFIAKDVANQQLLEACPGYVIPDMPRLIDNVIQYLILTKWGREPYHGRSMKEAIA